MKLPELLAGYLSGEPDLAHREDFGAEVDVVHVPDDNRQERQDGLIAVDDDEDVVDPEREQSQRELHVPHEEPAEDHHERPPSQGPVLELLDEVVAAIKGMFFEEPVGVLPEKFLAYPQLVEEAGEPKVIAEELDGVLDILPPGNHLSEVVPAPLGEGGIKQVPDEVGDHEHCGDAVDDAADVKAASAWEEPLEEFDVVEKEGQPGDDQKKESGDQQPVLDPLGKVHPQENFVIPDERGAIHAFLS